MTLELFPKHPEADAYRVGGAYQPYAVVAVDKRFTDAELAAEYWMCSSRKERMMSYGGGMGSSTFEQALEERCRMEDIARFARLPHASDTNYE